MAKNTDIQRQLDALRGEMYALRDREDELHAIAKTTQTLKNQKKIARGTARGTCTLPAPHSSCH